MADSHVKASVLHGARDLRIESRQLPRPSAGEVQVSILSTGLCGSDLHYFNHFRNGDIRVLEPLTLGHESAGRVVAVGPGVTGFKEGDRVALEVGLPCEKCPLCLKGRYNICKGMRFRSSAKIFPHAQGTLQEKINHAAKWCHKLPDEMSFGMGSLLEPLSVAMHAKDRVGMPLSGATVLVLGAGAVGLLCAAVCKTEKANVLIADINQDRIAFAVRHGFADAAVLVPMVRPETVDQKLEFAKSVAEAIRTAGVNGCETGEPHISFECTGVEACLQTAIYATRSGGKVMLIGMGNPTQTLPISAASLREVDLVGVFRYADTYPKSIQLVSEKPPLLPDLDTLITHRYDGMGQIQSAFDMAARLKDDDGNLVLKVVVQMKE